MKTSRVGRAFKEKKKNSYGKKRKVCGGKKQKTVKEKIALKRGNFSQYKRGERNQKQSKKVRTVERKTFQKRRKGKT